MDIPYHSDEAKKINILIFETIYHAALERSYEMAAERHTAFNYILEYYKTLWNFETNKPHCRKYMTNKQITSFSNSDDIFNKLDKLKPTYSEINNLSKEHIGSYSSFEGSPISRGIFQFDMWGVTPSNRYDWETLRSNIKTRGIRNSLLVAPMPTASTSQILGNNECFEPFTSNIYTRRTLAGEFICVNKHLIKELLNINLWNDNIKNSIIEHKGSIQQLSIIPAHIREKYKIVWEIPMKHLIEMSADRGAFICQSQSLNLWMKNPSYKSLTAMHFFSWEKGLKTGLYYLRSRAKASPQQFTIEPTQQLNSPPEEEGICEMCSG